MSIDGSWDNDEKPIIRYDYGQGWTWDEFKQATATSDEMVSSVTHTVDFITDFSSGSAPPMGALGKFKSAQENSPENVGAIVIVGGSMFVNTLVSTFSRIYRAMGEQLMVASTVDESREKIAARRSDARV